MKKQILFKTVIIFIISITNLFGEVKPIIDGSKDAKIRIIIFESLTCSHCANFHKNVFPKLKEDFLDKGYASIEFRSFPLDMAAFNASKIAHCKNDGKSKILHYLYENQNNWVKGNTIKDLNENLKKVVKDADFNLDFDVCLADKKIEDYILEDRIEGVKKFEINSTPTLIINDKKFENPSNYKQLKKYLEKLI
tara:strand:- start:47 stop:628 length:582 start_codon:yes stop_codon:yes gene_type:complete